MWRNVGNKFSCVNIHWHLLLPYSSFCPSVFDILFRSFIFVAMLYEIFAFFIRRNNEIYCIFIIFRSFFPSLYKLGFFFIFHDIWIGIVLWLPSFLLPFLVFVLDISFIILFLYRMRMFLQLQYFSYLSFSSFIDFIFFSLPVPISPNETLQVPTVELAYRMSADCEIYPIYPKSDIYENFYCFVLWGSKILSDISDYPI